MHNVARQLRISIGSNLLPLADPAGRYAISPLVTVDALRLVALVDAARTADDRAGIGLLTKALELIEDAPLVDVRTGYAWWDDDAYAHQTERAAVEAACALVPLVLESDLPLARWAVHKARLVARDAEALYALTITIAGAMGDRVRARLIYDQCQVMLRNLDPNAVPREDTERAFREAMGTR